MIQFTDPRLYVKGICSAQLADPTSGDIWFSSNKFTTGNITFSANTDPLRAGLGNPIAVIVETDSDITINFTQANFDLAAKMAAVGGSVSYNAVVPVCQTVTASGASLTVDVSGGTPAAPYGYANAICYVQTVGAASLVGTDGEAYQIDPLTGAISGFAATSGTQYKVWYYTAKPTAVVGTVNSAMVGRVGMFTAQIAVYSNTGAGNQGTRVGWLYVHSLIKLLPEGANLSGDNSNYDTTVISGRAISADENVVSATCEDCGTSNLMYYVYSPESGADEVVGLAVFGGSVTVKRSTTAQIPVRFVLANNETVPVTDFTGFTFTGSGLPSGTTVSNKGVISAGATNGDGEIAVSYTNGSTTLTCPVNVSVTA